MDNLSHVQALILAFLTSLILTTIFAFSQVNFDISNIMNLNEPQLLIIVAIIFAVMTYLLLVIGYILPRKDVEQFEKEFEAAKEDVLSNYHLTKETYTEVKLNFEKFLNNVDEDTNEVILTILNNSNCRFYAKLIDSEETDAIEVVGKDINNNTIYSTTIYNFIFFKNFFEKIDY